MALTLSFLRTLETKMADTLVGFSLRLAGECVSLSDDRLMATYTGDNAGPGQPFGGVFGDGPIKASDVGSYFEVQISELTSGNNDGLAIGVATALPETVPERLTSAKGVWLVGFEGHMWNDFFQEFE